MFSGLRSRWIMLLEHLHSKSIIHRDLKPDNILLQGETPRLADFGIARVLKTTSPYSTMISGTPQYMAPEAYKGKRSEQTDLWSAGVILHQLIAGSSPFPQEDPASVMFAVLTERPAPLPPSTPEHLRGVVTKSLEKEPERRYRNAAEMREAVRRFIHSQGTGGGRTSDEVDIPTVRNFPETSILTPQRSDVSHATSLEPPDEEETRLRKSEDRAIEFIGNDDAYLRWLSANTAGYVVNT